MWSSAWTCDRHGEVLPLHAAAPPTADALKVVIGKAKVPVWLAWPLPKSWLVSGATYAGDDRSGARATVLALSGPAPFGGPGDLIFVAEEPGIGLGARYAGLATADPGAGFMATTPATKIHVKGRPTPLWEIAAASDRTAFVGEAGGLWLWAVAWPETASLIVHDHLHLVDLREAGHVVDPPFGAPSPRIHAKPAQ
jgi:hypothetical protein